MKTKEYIHYTEYGTFTKEVTRVLMGGKQHMYTVTKLSGEWPDTSTLVRFCNEFGSLDGIHFTLDGTTARVTCDIEPPQREIFLTVGQP